MLYDRLEQGAGRGQLRMSVETASRIVMSVTTGAALSLISQPDLYGDGTFAAQLREAVIAWITVTPGAESGTHKPERPAPVHDRQRMVQRRGRRQGQDRAGSVRRPRGPVGGLSVGSRRQDPAPRVSADRHRRRRGLCGRPHSRRCRLGPCRRSAQPGRLSPGLAATSAETDGQYAKRRGLGRNPRQTRPGRDPRRSAALVLVPGSGGGATPDGLLAGLARPMPGRRTTARAVELIVDRRGPEPSPR